MICFLTFMFTCYATIIIVIIISVSNLIVRVNEIRLLTYIHSLDRN